VAIAPRPAGAAEKLSAVTTQPMDFGTDGLDIAPGVEVVNIPPRTIELIGAALARETGARRLRLARDLGECRSALALPLLRTLLTDHDPLMRAQAAVSAGKVGDHSILPDLREMLKDASAAVRREAVISCAGLGDTEAVAQALADADTVVLATAIRLSTTPAHADAIARRLGELRPVLRAQALGRLGEIGSAAQGQTIARFLKSDVAARAAAIDALARLHAVDQAGSIVPMLDDAHPSVRRAATTALISLAKPEAATARAITMLGDADPAVRQAAAEVLEARPTADAVPRLVEQLGSGDEPLRRAARDALVATKDAAIAAAVQLLADRDPQRREDGSYILGHLRNDASIQQHVALLRDASWTVVAQAAESLGRIGRAEAAEPLAALVKQIPATASVLPSEQQRAFSEACIALVRLGHRPAAADFARLVVELAPNAQRGPTPRLRAACAWGFGVLGTSNDTATCAALLATVNEFLEQSEVKVESIKALGTLRYAPAAAELKRLGQTSVDPELRWMACWSYERITGSPLTYESPRNTVAPDISIVVLP
jgi:HEAT repeat protein